VLTATGFVNGKWQFSTFTESTPITKKMVQMIISASHTAVPNLVQIRPRGLLGKWVKYNDFLFFIYTFFHQLTGRSDGTTDFHAWWLKQRELKQECAFWGFR